MIFHKEGVERVWTILLIYEEIPVDVIIHLQEAAKARQYSYCDHWSLSVTATYSNIVTVTL